MEIRNEHTIKLIIDNVTNSVLMLQAKLSLPEDITQGIVNLAEDKPSYLVTLVVSGCGITDLPRQVATHVLLWLIRQKNNYKLEKLRSFNPHVMQEILIAMNDS